MTAANPTGVARARPQEIACNSDAQLELAIAYARDCLYAAPTWDEKLVRWREWVRLIDQRSPSRARFLQRLEGMR